MPCKEKIARNCAFLYVNGKQRKDLSIKLNVLLCRMRDRIRTRVYVKNQISIPKEVMLIPLIRNTVPVL
jgi:hypothetical protein